MKIAIQGNLKRGKEVIQILENLGGINRMNHSGGYTNYFYYISGDDNTIAWTCVRPQHLGVFTLEEFEKKFPFKIGDKVLSITTNLIATIIELEEGGCYYIKYDNGNLSCAFGQNLKLYKKMQEERNITLTLDKAKEWYKKGGELKEIALQAFTEKELNPLPRSWEEFCEKYPIQDHEAFINYANGNITVCKECAGSGLGIWKRKPEKDRCKCVSQRSAEAHLAMIQLEQLRDYWRQGWEPKPGNNSFAIKVLKEKLEVCCFCSREFLSFPTKEMAEEFLKCFRDLIEKAGDLI